MEQNEKLRRVQSVASGTAGSFRIENLPIQRRTAYDRPDRKSYSILEESYFTTSMDMDDSDEGLPSSTGAVTESHSHRNSQILSTRNLEEPEEALNPSANRLVRRGATIKRNPSIRRTLTKKPSFNTVLVNDNVGAVSVAASDQALEELIERKCQQIASHMTDKGGKRSLG